MYQQLQEEDSDSQFEFENPFQFDLQETLYTHKLDKILGTWSGVWLVVGVCIGSGIFASPGLVYDDTQSVGASLCVWLFSGVLSMLGALCYIELGTSYPDSGGELVYLTKAFGPSLGFIYSFCAVLLQRPASIAIISSTFAEYLDRSLNLPDFVSQITAPLFILILTLMNIYSVEKTQLFQHTSTITKLLCILLIGCLAMIRVVVGPRNGMLFETDLFHGSSSELGKYAVASYFSLWAYDGWNTLNLVTEEFQDPSTNLPKAVLQGLLLVTCSYIIINFTYFIVLSKEVFVDSITIALDFAEHIFGTYGPLLMTVIVFIAAASALNASIFASSRLLVAMSRRGHGPQKLGIVHQKTNTPVHSLILQLILSTIYCQVGDIKSLLTLYSFGTWFFYFLTVFGLLVLRYTDPYCSRPFKVWLIVPILFCGLSFFLVLFSVYHTPMAAIVFFSLILTSSLIYLLASRANMTFEDYLESCRVSLARFFPK
ncbi:amino acid/polyamine transporter I, partial [Gorgonomyces haynaldii]